MSFVVRQFPTRVATFACLQWAGNAVMFGALVLVARRLGAVGFGAFAFAQVLIQYAILLVEFGYPAGGTQRVARLRDDPQALSRTFSTILAAQLALAVVLVAVAAVAWGVGVTWGAGWRMSAALVLAGSVAILGTALQSSWLLLGLERLHELAGIQLAGKLAALLVALLVVQGPGDEAWAVFALGLAPLVSGVVMLARSFRKGWVRWHRPTWAQVGGELRQAFVVFAPGAVSGAYTTLPALALGLLASPAAVAYYALADRLKGIVALLLQPFPTALIARMSVLFGTSDSAAGRLLVRSVVFHAVAGGLGSCALFFGAGPLVVGVAGAEFAGAAHVLRWLALVPLVVSLSNVASLHVLLAAGYARTIHRVVLFVSVTGLMWLWPFVRQGGEIAAAQFVLVSELLACALMWLFAVRVLRRRPGMPPGSADRMPGAPGG